MRVLDCDTCGETLQAANDDELARGLREHLRAEHGQEITEDDAAGLVAAGAYDAMDS